MMSFDEFVTSHTDSDVEFPNCDVNQCMTLMHRYIADVLEIEDPMVLAVDPALKVFTEFGSLVGHEKFEIIGNTLYGVPQKGDVVVFGDRIGEDGHVCIFIEGDHLHFKSFDANWPIGSKPHVQEHDYTGCLGWLRPRAHVAPAAQPEEYKGLDLSNTESVKAAIDAWSDVAHGFYIHKSVVEQALGLPENSEDQAIVDAITKLKEPVAADSAAVEGAAVAQKESILQKFEQFLTDLKSV